VAIRKVVSRMATAEECADAQKNSEESIQ